MKILAAIRKIRRLLSVMSDFPERFEDLQQSIGRIELRQLEFSTSSKIRDHEFKVFSQNGEDGILQFLLKQIPIVNRIFVEFGVHDYMESNTRFLLKHCNWSGLVIDGNRKNIEHIRTDQLFWKHRLRAECSFITRENINDIITKNKISGDIGLLSIDIDGNDYWVWEAIHCISPRIVVCEYNGLFGGSAKLSTRYAPDFDYRKAHFSTLFCGASIAAFHYLGGKKGYSLVGSNSGGNNVFLVRNDVMGTLGSLSPELAYVPYSFRTSRDQAGNLSYLDFSECVDLIADLPLVDVSTNLETTLRRGNEIVNSVL